MMKVLNNRAYVIFWESREKYGAQAILHDHNGVLYNLQDDCPPPVELTGVFSTPALVLIVEGCGFRKRWIEKLSYEHMIEIDRFQEGSGSAFRVMMHAIMDGFQEPFYLPKSEWPGGEGRIYSWRVILRWMDDELKGMIPPEDFFTKTGFWHYLNAYLQLDPAFSVFRDSRFSVFRDSSQGV